ncbi:MAG TPA: NUDIX domain-containing protein, partial [Polyangiaceae bacterium]|nr:NUDIX domain-containing protein [Polyangiaceae bacterium]
KKKPPREVRMVALVARRGPSVLLGLREAGGLFGGLWEPPMIEAHAGENPEASLAAFLGLDFRDFEVVVEQTHVLTHRRLRISVAAAAVSGEPRRAAAPYERFAWCAVREVQKLGMSSLAKKVLLACPGRHA